MKRVFFLLTVLLTASSISLSGYDNTFMDYQNYNHGYCPECNCYPCKCAAAQVEETDPEACSECNTPVEEEEAPCAIPSACPAGSCDPCAPVCGKEKGFSIYAIGVVLVAVAAAAAILISSGKGGSTQVNN